MRLFIGVELSDPVKAALARAVADPEKDRIAGALEAIAETRKAFTLSVRGLGAFPDPRRPSILWAGIGGGAVELTELASKLGPKMAELGRPPEPRPFTPHVTLGRMKSGKNLESVRSTLKKNLETAFGSCEARALALFQSRQTKHGSEYEVLSRHFFGTR